MQFYCGRLFNFLRFREKDNSIIFDLLPEQEARIAKGESTYDDIYNEIMQAPHEYVKKTKENGIKNLISICGRLGENAKRSNGAGKSTILESLTYALYGCIIRQSINAVKNESVYDFVTCIDQKHPKGLKESWSEWLFEEKGKLYLVKRGATISGKSKIPLVEFYDVTNGEKNSLSSHRTKETSNEILKVINCDFDVFSSSIMFGQSDAGQFLIGKDKDRKEMIIKILHLEDVVDGCLENIRESKNSKEKEIKELQSQERIVTERLENKSPVEEIEKQINENEELIKECDKTSKENDGKIDELSRSDVLKKLENIKSEGLKIKDEIEAKKTEKDTKTEEWKSLAGKTSKNIEKNKDETKSIEQKEISILNSIKSLKREISEFDIDKTNKDLETVEKARKVKPSIVSKIDDFSGKIGKLSESIAVQSANVSRYSKEKTLLESQIDNDKSEGSFICDKCKSVVTKEHIEKELKTVIDEINKCTKEKDTLEKETEVLGKELEEFKTKKRKVDEWLDKESKLKLSLQNNAHNKEKIKEQEARIEENKNSLKSLWENLKSIEKELEEYTEKIKEINVQFDESVKALNDKRESLKSEYLKIKEDADNVGSKINTLRKQNEETSNRKSEYSSKIGSFKKDIENIEVENKNLVKIKSDIEAKTKELQRYIILNDVFGLDGIQTRLVNKYLPILNKYIDEFLSILSNGEMSVRILTNEKSDIDIEITGNTGNSYNMISGGEKGLLRLSISIGLSLLSFVRSSQKPEMICLDEIFGSLDEARRDAVFALLKKLKGYFDRIIVIAHNTEINENIPNKIMVEKSEGHDGTSKISCIM